MLIGLDLSCSAVGTVDRQILLERLETEFGVERTPLTWLRSYIDGWTQYVKIGQHQSTAIELEVGVPQGSVLGPILFAIYANPVADVITVVFSATSMLMTRGFTLRCAPTTHPLGCPFLLHVLPTSDSPSRYICPG